MVLKLHGSPVSTCTKRVAMVLHEKNVPFEFHPVDLAKGEQKAPEFISRQPFGQVPYIDDDGFILYESRAIRSTSLQNMPTKAHHWSQRTSRITLSSGKVLQLKHPTSILMLRNSHTKDSLNRDIYGLQTSEEAAKQAEDLLNAKLDVYEQILSKQKYISGNALTLADLFHLPYGALLALCKCDAIEKRPAVAKWFNELVSRPSWQAVQGGVKGTA
ncbi:glutathione S-transferase 1 [Coccidioides immitis RMSCC 3703]|uniref:glutathione transferase n=1 Tax=Coccidioides immitis RMSCC 3703 TaxID=454286 RepID=A0A0J8TQ22_COCIT|nr:glutathione S-transferase 1 [Coccidioides immitis RMSCC 3703]